MCCCCLVLHIRREPEAETNWGTAESNDETGNSEEGGHVDIQIEMGSEGCVGTRQAATVGYSSRFSQ